MQAPQNPVSWFAICVADPARARMFYQTVFKRPLMPWVSTDPAIDMLAFVGDFAVWLPTWRRRTYGNAAPRIPFLC